MELPVKIGSEVYITRMWANFSNLDQSINIGAAYIKRTQHEYCKVQRAHI